MSTLAIDRTLVEALKDVEDVLAYCASHSTPLDECRDFVKEVLSDLSGVRFGVFVRGDSYGAVVRRGGVEITVICTRRGVCHRVYG